MVGEEIGLNEALEAAALRVIETDLGEYIIQLAEEPPSHIIAPAVHKSRGEIAELFQAHHHGEEFTRPLETVPDIVDEARKVLRNEFLGADVGITGAKMLIADTGSTALVTNEGNGDLTASLPRVHIVIASIEKVVQHSRTPQYCCVCLHAVPPVSQSLPIPVFSPAQSAVRILAGRSSFMSYWSITAAARCSAMPTARCCTASAAVPVLTTARSTVPSAGMPMAGFTLGRWVQY